MESEIKAIRKQKIDEDYKSKESVRNAMHKYYYRTKEISPDIYKEKNKRNKERYHAKKKEFEETKKMLEQYKNMMGLIKAN